MGWFCRLSLPGLLPAGPVPCPAPGVCGCEPFGAGGADGLAAAFVMIIAGRQILNANPLGRITITVAAPLAALLRFTTAQAQGSIEVDFGTWIQAALAIATVVVLWVPAASAFFAKSRPSAIPPAHHEF